MSEPNWKVDTLTRIIRHAKKSREKIDAVCEELERYAEADTPENDSEWDPDNHFGAKVYKTSQAVRELGPRLYNQNPVINASVDDSLDFEREPEAWYRARERGEVMEDYLNYTMDVTDFRQNMEEAINESLYAWGVLWYAIDANNPHAVSVVQDSWKNVWFDPDAKKFRDGRVLIRRRYRPKWELQQKYPHVSAMIEELPGVKKPSDRAASASDAMVDATSDLIEYYDVYMTAGLHNYREGFRDGKKGVDEPLKYCVVPDEFLLYEGTWETPYHRRGKWPCEIIYYYPSLNSPYPVSPLRPGLGWQRVLNWLGTRIVAKFGASNKQVLAYARQLGMSIEAEDLEEILYGTNPVATIQLDLNDMREGAHISELIQNFQLNGEVEGDIRMFQYVSRLFEEETGLSRILITGEAENQDRSAAATRLREKNVFSRIDDMQTKLDGIMADVMDQIKLTAMFHMRPEDIRVTVGEAASQLWPRLLDAEEADEDALRARFEGSGMDTPEATMAAQMALQNGVTLEEWDNETSIDVELGSTRRKSPQEEEEVYDRLNNQMGPMFLQSGMPQVAAELAARQIEAAGGTPEIVRMVRQLGAQKQQIIQMQEQMALSQMMNPQPAPAAQPQGQS